MKYQTVCGVGKVVYIFFKSFHYYNKKDSTLCYIKEYKIYNEDR